MTRRVLQLAILPVALLTTMVGLLALAARPNPYQSHPQPPASTQAENLIGYNIYRSAEPGGPYRVIASRVAKPTYVDRKVESGKTYYYVVTSTTWLHPLTVRGGKASPEEIRHRPVGKSHIKRPTQLGG
jgi:hypothetical protein